MIFSYSSNLHIKDLNFLFPISIPQNIISLFFYLYYSVKTNIGGVKHSKTSMHVAFDYMFYISGKQDRSMMDVLFSAYIHVVFVLTTVFS